MKPNKKGFYNEFGGAFIPELLYKNINDLKKAMLIIKSASFKSQYQNLLKNYVGRPSPLYYSNYLSQKYSARIYLKREDLNHTGSHKINNAIGQVLLAKIMGKKNIIAETGAGQHGVATATACALLNMPCTVFMGKIDVIRQSQNVQRMKMLNANIIEVNSGSQTLKDATNEAIRFWINHANESYYVIGSVVGPHPYPMLVTKFQSIISKEIKVQLKHQLRFELPDMVLACVGGGSNAAGAFYHFIKNNSVKLYAAEAGGKGIYSGKTAASISVGKPGILHGSYSFLLQDNDGQITEPHSISAGLDYPGVGPLHSALHKSKRVKYIPVNDDEALQAGIDLMHNDGIIPAIESAHALALLNKIIIKTNCVIVICLSGRGDKDIATYNSYIEN